MIVDIAIRAPRDQHEYAGGAEACDVQRELVLIAWRTWLKSTHHPGVRHHGAGTTLPRRMPAPTDGTGYELCLMFE